jgi:NADPH:quinone reductase
MELITSSKLLSERTSRPTRRRWRRGGSIATYATNTPMPETPVWQLVFVNARLFFVGSDDVPAEAKIEATQDINKALEMGWQGLDIAEIVPLDQIARAHELVEHPVKPGRVIVAVTSERISGSGQSSS